jgi:hypothetical protein
MNMNNLIIKRRIWRAIEDGEWGLFLGDNGKQKSAWIKNKTHGITNSSNYAFGATHQEALDNLDENLSIEE